VDPGPEGALLDECVRRRYPILQDKQFTSSAPELFPVSSAGAPIGDHIARLIDISQDPTLIPDTLNFRMLSGAATPGQGRYWLDRYLRERGDANIKTTADFIEKANYYQDPNFPDHRQRHVRTAAEMQIDMAARMLNRFAVQTTVLQCMGEMQLDALVYPTSNMPPLKLGAPRGPDVKGRPGDGVWRFLGRNGFPVITVPAGFTSQTYDRVRVAGSEKETELVGPVVAKLPIGVDFVAAPFGEPMLLRIASAYESATKHRSPPPAFGPVEPET
jgi:Asp-tRNA(Asn)/Glu-tRNA(Gln) amidotransferase A subunit family amidase